MVASRCSDRRSGRRPSARRCDFERCIDTLVRESPQDHGYPRPTWTRELLILVAEELDGRAREPHPDGARPAANRCASRSTEAHRALSVVATSSATPAAAIKQLIDLLAERGRRLRGRADVRPQPEDRARLDGARQQRAHRHARQQQEAYLAGALDARDGTVLWVGAEQKNSALFVAMLDRLDAHYRARSTSTSCSTTTHPLEPRRGAHCARLPRIRLTSAVLLARSQPNRATLAGPTRQRHAQPPAHDARGPLRRRRGVARCRLAVAPEHAMSLYSAVRDRRRRARNGLETERSTDRCPRSWTGDLED